MQGWLVTASELAIVVIDALALALILFGTLGAFAAVIRALIANVDGHSRRDIWLGYSHWLVAALTFQLAADIIESAITTSWDAVGRLAAIAAIRTFLNYFLERDVTEFRQRQHEHT